MVLNVLGLLLSNTKGFPREKFGCLRRLLANYRENILKVNTDPSGLVNRLLRLSDWQHFSYRDQRGVSCTHMHLFVFFRGAVSSRHDYATANIYDFHTVVENAFSKKFVFFENWILGNYGFAFWKQNFGNSWSLGLVYKGFAVFEFWGYFAAWSSTHFVSTAILDLRLIRVLKVFGRVKLCFQKQILMGTSQH